MIVIREDRRLGSLVENILMFSGIVSIDGSVQSPTAQHSLAPNLPVHHQRWVMLCSVCFR